MYLILDIGNTRVKKAIYEADHLIAVDAFDKAFFHQEIEKTAQEFAIDKAIFSAVGELTKHDKHLINSYFDCMELTATTPLPFANQYETPGTLGVDRIALSAAAVDAFPDKNVLIIDAGTCITYDFITQNKEYVGGAISPGLRSRYKSLSDYTQNLPLLDKKTPHSFIGINTEEAIHSGVVNGVCREIDGVIAQYRASYKKLTIVLTGGDADFLSSQLKSSIFVRPFFLLEGLYSILKYNL